MALQLFGEIAIPYKGTYAPAGVEYTGFGNFINNAVNGIMVGGGLLLFFYLIYGGFRYVTAGGDEKAVDGAKQTMTNAVIGLMVIAGAWFITKIAETMLGIHILTPIFQGP